MFHALKSAVYEGRLKLSLNSSTIVADAEVPVLRVIDLLIFNIMVYFFVKLIKNYVNAPRSRKAFTT